MIDATIRLSSQGQRIATFGRNILKINYKFFYRFYTLHNLLYPPLWGTADLYGKLKMTVAHQHFYISVAAACTYLQCIHSASPHSAYGYMS